MKRALWVGVYAIAMAAVESAVVVYLRALHEGAAPASVLQYQLPMRLLSIEAGREAATLVMLITVAVLASRNAWEGLLYFALAFGLWDIFYYVWLWVFIGWPPSLFTWDVLFLIPDPSCGCRVVRGCSRVSAACSCCCLSRSITAMRSRALIHRASGGRYSRLG